MTIRLHCPHGHALSVADSWAGKQGLCPVCKARVQVPQVAPLSEDAILDLLGPRAPPDSADDSSIRRSSKSGGSGIGLLSGSSVPPKKSCDNCHREISATDHICPFCRKYIANLGDF